MARKSPWQEFAENFKGVYGTFKQIGQDVETSRIMDDERFTGEGGLGAGLKGNALEEARYKALGDIYTKYGNAKQGLEMRQGLANLEEKRRSNDLNEAILKNQINIQGTLAEQLARGNVNLTNANTQNVKSTTDARNKKLPYEITGLANANRSSQLANEFTEQTQSNAITALNKQNEQAIDEADTEIALSGMKWQERYAQVEAGINEAKAKGNAAALENFSSELFLAYAEDYNSGAFESGEEASDAFVSIVGAFDPERAAKLANSYTTEQIGSIANEGLMIQNEVARFVQDRDLAGLRKYFDDKNGDQFGVSLSQDAETGAVKMVELDADGNPVRDIISATNEAEALQDLQALSTFGNGAAYAELLFDRKKKTLELEQAEANIDATKSNTGLTDEKINYQEILNDTTRYANLVKNDNIKAQTELATAQVEKLKQEVGAKEGITFEKELGIKAYNKFITGETYSVMVETLQSADNGAEKLRQYEDMVKFGLGLLPKTQAAIAANVSNAEWIAMTEKERISFSGN